MIKLVKSWSVMAISTLTLLLHATEAPLTLSKRDQDIRTVVRYYAGSDDVEARSREFAVISNYGMEIFPFLKKLFQEDLDGYYRDAIVGIMFDIPGGNSAAAAFVQAELTKEPAAWGGKAWIVSSLWRIGKNDTEQAKLVGFRILESGQDWLLLSSALGFFEKFADFSELTQIERFIAECEQRPPFEGKEAVLRGAHRAIDVIKQRAESNQRSADSKSVMNGSTQPISEEKSVHTVATAAAPPDTSMPRSTRGWAMLGIAGSTICVLIAFLVWRSSKK